MDQKNIPEFKLTHSRARQVLVKEFTKQINTHVQIVEHYLHPGIPDLNVCVNGTEYWLEVKIDKDKLRTEQQLWMEMRRRCGGNVGVIRFINDKIVYEAEGCKIIYDSVKEFIENFVSTG